MIGFSLAAVVAGSLVALTMMAQRVSLTGATAGPVAPHEVSSAPGDPLVIGAARPAPPERSSKRIKASEVKDQVLGTRTSRPDRTPDTDRRRRTERTAPERRERTTSQSTTPDRNRGGERHAGKALGHHKGRGEGHDKHEHERD